MADHAEVREAVATVAAAAEETLAADDAIDAANEAREDAEELAADLAAAAIEGERGQRIEALEREIASWPEKLAAALQTIRTELMAMVETVKAQTPLPAAASPAVEAATAAAVMTAETSSAPSSATVTEQTTVTVEPAQASPGAAEGAPPEAAPRRKPKFL